jgi:succinyl-CoA synthetase beta subunit
MKIHEFQAKELLSNYNVPIQRGYVVYSSNEIEKTIDKVQKEFNSDAVVVKAQIHAGGRGKGGGVKFCSSTESAIKSANEILGMNLITHQTGEDG